MNNDQRSHPVTKESLWSYPRMVKAGGCMWDSLRRCLKVRPQRRLTQMAFLNGSQLTGGSRKSSGRRGVQEDQVRDFCVVREDVWLWKRTGRNSVHKERLKVQENIGRMSLTERKKGWDPDHHWRIIQISFNRIRDNWEALEAYQR